MSAEQRNFHDYYLGDNVYELAGGLIPEIAELLEVDLGPQPNSESLSQLVGKLGANKVLRNNVEVEAIDSYQMADFVDQSGVQRELSRSLWSPEITPRNRGVSIAVLSGGVANWQNRSAAAIPSWFNGLVLLPTGNRIMNGPTEVNHPDVKALESILQTPPTEFEYASHVITDKIVDFAGNKLRSIPLPFESAKGHEIATQFFEKNPKLLEEKLLFVRVANAGIQLAVEMRKAARQLNSDFDQDPQNPQVYIQTDEFPVSRSAEEDARPTQFQKAQTGLRQVALTAKSLFEATQ